MSKIAHYINQIQDPAAQKALQLLFEELTDAFDAHTHNADGAQVGSYFTSPPRSDTATVTAGTALTFPEKG